MTSNRKSKRLTQLAFGLLVGCSIPLLSSVAGTKQVMAQEGAGASMTVVTKTVGALAEPTVQSACVGTLFAGQVCAAIIKPQNIELGLTGRVHVEVIRNGIDRFSPVLEPIPGSVFPSGFTFPPLVSGANAFEVVISYDLPAPGDLGLWTFRQAKNDWTRWFGRGAPVVNSVPSRGNPRLELQGLRSPRTAKTVVRTNGLTGEFELTGFAQSSGGGYFSGEIQSFSRDWSLLSKSEIRFGEQGQTRNTSRPFSARINLSSNAEFVLVGFSYYFAKSEEAPSLSGIVLGRVGAGFIASNSRPPITTPPATFLPTSTNQPSSATTTLVPTTTAVSPSSRVLTKSDFVIGSNGGSACTGSRVPVDVGWEILVAPSLLDSGGKLLFNSVGPAIGSAGIGLSDFVFENVGGKPFSNDPRGVTGVATSFMQIEQRFLGTADFAPSSRSLTVSVPLTTLSVSDQQVIGKPIRFAASYKDPKTNLDVLPREYSFEVLYSDGSPFDGRLVTSPDPTSFETVISQSGNFLARLQVNDGRFCTVRTARFSVFRDIGPGVTTTTAAPGTKTLTAISPAFGGFLGCRGRVGSRALVDTVTVVPLLVDYQGKQIFYGFTNYVDVSGVSVDDFSIELISGLPSFKKVQYGFETLASNLAKFKIVFRGTERFAPSERVVTVSVPVPSLSIEGAATVGQPIRMTATFREFAPLSSAVPESSRVFVEVTRADGTPYSGYEATPINTDGSIFLTVKEPGNYLARIEVVGTEGYGICTEAKTPFTVLNSPSPTTIPTLTTLTSVPPTTTPPPATVTTTPIPTSTSIATVPPSQPSTSTIPLTTSTKPSVSTTSVIPLVTTSTVLASPFFIATPASDTVQGNPLAVRISNPLGVARVDWLLNGIPIGSDVSPQDPLIVDLAGWGRGPFWLEAVVVDAKTWKETKTLGVAFSIR
jgi:hypothetical protein